MKRPDDLPDYLDRFNISEDEPISISINPEDPIPDCFLPEDIPIIKPKVNPNVCRCSHRIEVHTIPQPDKPNKCQNKSCINKCKGFIPSSGKRRAQIEQRKLEHKLAGIKYKEF